MATKYLSKQSLTTTSADKKYQLGETYCEAGDANGEKKYKYIEYDDGTANITAGTYRVVVPVGTTHSIEPVKYTGDKTNMISSNLGGLAGISVGLFTATNKYGFIQIAGPSHIRIGAAATTALHTKFKATIGGADLLPEVATATTYAQGVFAVATSAGTTSGPINVYLPGPSVI